MDAPGLQHLVGLRVLPHLDWRGVNPTAVRSARASERDLNFTRVRPGGNRAALPRPLIRPGKRDFPAQLVMVRGKFKRGGSLQAARLTGRRGGATNLSQSRRPFAEPEDGRWPLCVPPTSRRWPGGAPWNRPAKLLPDKRAQARAVSAAARRGNLLPMDFASATLNSGCAPAAAPDLGPSRRTCVVFCAAIFFLVRSYWGLTLIELGGADFGVNQPQVKLPVCWARGRWKESHSAILRRMGLAADGDSAVTSCQVPWLCGNLHAQKKSTCLRARLRPLVRGCGILELYSPGQP